MTNGALTVHDVYGNETVLALLSDYKTLRQQPAPIIVAVSRIAEDLFRKLHPEVSWMLRSEDGIIKLDISVLQIEMIIRRPDITDRESFVSLADALTFLLDLAPLLTPWPFLQESMQNFRIPDASVSERLKAQANQLAESA